MTQTSPPTDMNSFLASVGHVCLQWSLLEHTILFIIGMGEEMPAEKACNRFAGLDMLPRLGMAISLAEEAKWPQRYTKRLRNIRKAIQSGLNDQRNLFVHGVHEATGVEGEFQLTMSRWKGDRRCQIVTILEASELAHQLSLLAQEAQSIFSDYGVWKFGAERYHDVFQQPAQTKAALRLIRRQNIKRGFKLIFTNLKP